MTAQPYLIDTHCHLHDRSVYDFALSRQKKQTVEDFTPEKIFDRMNENDVKQAICIGTTHADSLAARAFAEEHENIFYSYGIHPEEATLDAARERTSLLSSSKLVAIGEVGLDYHSETYNREAQIALFEQMLDLATRNDLPLIFHVRDAFDDFFTVLDNFRTKNPRGVVHSFSDSQKNLEKSLNRDFLIGVNGLATFTNLPLPPLERILLETDAPFLAPVPYRGRVNDPSHIKDIALWLAKKQGTTLELVAEITTKNAKSLFRLPAPIASD